MRTNFVGRSVVSAITQTPASGPLGPVTTPAMSSASTGTPCWTLSIPMIRAPETAPTSNRPPNVNRPPTVVIIALLLGKPFGVRVIVGILGVAPADGQP